MPQSPSDDEILNTAFDRAESLLQRSTDGATHNITPAELAHLPTALEIAYAVTIYESEVTNGGHHQFFTNSSGTLAPNVSEALDAIGAGRHSALFHRALRANEALETEFPDYRERWQHSNSSTQATRQDASRATFMQAASARFGDLNDQFFEIDSEEPLHHQLAAYLRSQPATW